MLESNINSKNSYITYKNSEEVAAFFQNHEKKLSNLYKKI